MDVKLKPYSDPVRWVAIYPLYIDASKSLAQGRRIPKAKSINYPTSQEIFDVLNHAGLRCELDQKKTHPRAQARGNNPKQQQQEEGRVRVQLREDDGNGNDETAQKQQQKFMSRHQMMLYAAEMIPKLKTRQQNQGEQHENTAFGKQKKRK